MIRRLTDDQDEVFDIVDEDDNVIGKATRGEVHSNKKLIHRSIGVAVFNEKGEIFLQQRSATKDTDPMMWTISCSGHVASGSSTIGGAMASQTQPVTPEVSLSLYEKTAHRELFEELGLEDLLLEFVAKYLCQAPKETEIAMLYRAKSDGPFRLNPEEILQGKFFTRKKLKEAVEKGEIRLSFMGEKALEKLGWIPLDKN